MLGHKGSFRRERWFQATPHPLKKNTRLNNHINKTRFQKFKSEIPISLLPLECSIIEWKSYDLLGQCDSRLRIYIEFYLGDAVDSRSPPLQSGWRSLYLEVTLFFFSKSQDDV